MAGTEQCALDARRRVRMTVHLGAAVQVECIVEIAARADGSGGEVWFLPETAGRPRR